MRVHLQKIFLLLFVCTNACSVDQGLPYPGSELDGTQLAEQVYFVNHLYAFENVEMGDQKGEQLKIFNAVPGRKITRLLARRYVNHRIDQENIKTKDLVVFTSGKQKGMGVLVTDYTLPGKSMSVSLWLPALRKVRRMNEPEHNEIWAGSILTYGDIYLRRPDEETHEIVDKKSLDDCLETMQYKADEWPDKSSPEEDCSVIGREVYLLKSTPKAADWWYDYRLQWVDTKYFTDYRIDYYKDGVRIKHMTKSWHQVEHDDPRAVVLKYWYTRSGINKQQSLIVMPVDSIKINTDRNDSFWSEATLRKIRR